jgi:predicted sulfurtransferase
MFRMCTRIKTKERAMGKKDWQMISFRLEGMIIILALISALTFGFAKTPQAKGRNVDAPTMTKEELRTRLGNPDVIILDVRVDSEWNESQSKIQGAIREDPRKVESWAKNFPKDKTLVLYCS